MNEDFISLLLAEVNTAIRTRVMAEVGPKINGLVREIVEQEVAAVAIRVSKYVEMRTMSDRLVIEVRVPGARP